MPCTLRRLTACLLILGAVGSSLCAQEPATPDEEWLKATEPSHVTVKFENTPLDEAFRQVAELTGNAILPAEAYPGGQYVGANSMVTMEFTNEPFWKVIGDLEAIVGSQLGPVDGTMAYRLGGQPTRDPTWTVFAGPARIQLTSAYFKREGRIDSELKGTLEYRTLETRLGFHVDVESRVTVTKGILRLMELVDDTGRDMLNKTHDRELREQRNTPPILAYGGGRTIGVGSWGNTEHTVSSGDPTVHIKAPAREATKIRLLKGRLELDLAKTVLPRAVFLKDLQEATSWAETTFSAKLERKGERINVMVTTGPSDDPSSVLKLLSEVRLYSSDERIRKGLVELPKTLPDGSIEARLSFWLDEELEPEAVLLPDIAPPRTQSYDFEMRDVPLPSLKAFYTELKPGNAPVPPAEPILPAPEGILPLSDLKGSTFTIKADNMPLAEMAKEIARQTGNRLDAPSEPSVGLEETRREPYLVTGEWENVEFWPGLTAICRSTGIGFARSNDRQKSAYSLWRPSQLVLQGRKEAPLFDGFRYIGPVRFHVNSKLEAESYLSYDVKPSMRDELRLEVHIEEEVEPGRIFQRRGASIEEYITSGSVDLLPRLPQRRKNGKAYAGHAEPDDPRCTGQYTIALSNSLFLNLHSTIEPEEAAERIARLRLYYAVDTYEDPDCVEITDPETPSTHKLADGLTISWLGLNEQYRRLYYRIDREGGLTPNDTEMLAGRRAAVINTNGERMPIGGYGRNGDGTVSIKLPPEHTPAKVLLCRNPKTYAGIVEFTDIPLPTLPPVP